VEIPGGLLPALPDPVFVAREVSLDLPVLSLFISEAQLREVRPLGVDVGPLPPEGFDDPRDRLLKEK